MIHFERSFDYGLIRGILTHPKIWPHISDDGSPPREEYKPVEHDAIWYVIVRDMDARLLGLWAFHPQNAVCWEVHMALLPAAWGPVGQRAARELPDWIWESTRCRRIVATIPETNRLALHFAYKAGMRIYGVNQQSFSKNGMLCDQICFGLSPHKTEAVSAIDQLTFDEEEACHRQQQP